MPSLDLNFWIGLALAIPLSIAGNLLTPWFQQYIGKRSERRSQARIGELLRELEEVENLAKNPQILIVDLLREVFILVFFTATFCLVIGTLLWLQQVFPLVLPWGSIVPGLGIAMAMVVANYSLNAAVKARNVRHIEKHRVALKRRLQELGHNAA